MIYTASESLTGLIDQVKKRLKINLFWGIFALFVYTPVFYVSVHKNAWVFIIIELILIFLFGLIDRGRALSMVLNLKKLAIEVQITDEYLLVKTAPVKVLLWADIAAEELKFIKHEFSRNLVNYPVKQIYGLDNKVWKL